MIGPDERSKKSQIEKFRAAAQELNTDQSEQSFDQMVKKIAKTPPPEYDKSKTTPQ